ncbi:MAG: hypothetical protein M0R51_11045 [Clostridia bacterium]|jgi:hypothetical protein|nr:hypothetical protein [Clostridia bacterium]
MFEYLEMRIWGDGTEHCVAYNNFALDDREIWYGASYELENDNKHNTWSINLYNQDGFIKKVAQGKEETLCLDEFKKWLSEHKVNDGYMNFLRENKWYCEKYSQANGVKFVA